MVKWFQTQREAVRTGAGSGGAWRCAGVALLTLVVFIGLNIAGCGGGGGGSNNPITPSPQPRSVTLALRDVNGKATNGAITLKGGSVNTTLNTVNSRATFQNVPAGTYQVTLNINGTVTTTSIAVTNENGQVFVVSPTGSGTITISGRVLLNPNNGSTAQCSTGGQGVTARVIIRVRDLNPTSGQPIVFSYIKPDQSNVSATQQGFYVVHLSRPGTYRVEARPTSDTVGAPFSGNSASFTVGPSQTSVANLDICANQCAPGQSACAPGGTPPAPPGTPTPGATVTPGGPTATPAPTVTPGGPATPTPGGAPTATPGGGPTVTPGGQPTPTTAATQTPVPTNTPVPTPIPGQATPTPAPTNTPIGVPVPTQPGGGP